MKVKAPFVLTYDGDEKIRCWGYGFGPAVGFPIRRMWSYCIGGISWRLPFGTVWTWPRSRRGVQAQIKSVL